MKTYRTILLSVLLFSILAGISSIYAQTTNTPLILTKPINYFTGRPIPSNFQLLKLISLVTDPKKQADDIKLVYQTYVAKGEVDSLKIKEFMKKHYAHLVINTVLLEHIENNKLAIPAETSLNAKTVWDVKQGYATFMDMIQKYYLREEYYVYEKDGNNSPTFREFVPVYTNAVQTAIDIETIEQQIFDYTNELLSNIEDKEGVANSIKNILKNVDKIKTKMPYNNLPDNLLIVLFQINDEFELLSTKIKEQELPLTQNSDELQN
ncbi:MAG: hypothetical protein A2Y40_00345 [Candidatus Margulisbacteria bacterium GWF2_35_9]|nr:MAG: hypothetical protein A2Y40_00345 [Candidatus Margulisbacteria bacterium GWF2_35_9]